MSTTTSRKGIPVNQNVFDEATTLSKTVGESDVYLFAGITGDLAPYHVDEQFMADSGYGGRIAHGVLLLGFVSTASTMFWTQNDGVGQTVSYGYDRVRFTGPVTIGDTITVTYRLIEFDEDKSLFRARAQIVTQRGETCLVAEHLTKRLDLKG